MAKKNIKRILGPLPQRRSRRTWTSTIPPKNMEILKEIRHEFQSGGMMGWYMTDLYKAVLRKGLIPNIKYNAFRVWLLEAIDD